MIIPRDLLMLPFVCPWCAARFAYRFMADVRRDAEPGPGGLASLEGHWAQYPECGANRAVNNPTNTKHLDHTNGPVLLSRPGSDTLRRVEEQRLRHLDDDPGA